MKYKSREEIVGKRFLSVRSLEKPEIGHISEWDWRSGIVRAVSSRDQTSVDFTILVEFDDIDWKRREWYRVHEIFQIFLVEHTLVWTARQSEAAQSSSALKYPALCFKPLVDKCGLSASKKRVVEFLVERDLAFVKDDDLHFYQEGEEAGHERCAGGGEVSQAVRRWVDYQDGQRILLTTPVVLVGSRLEVYRAQGTTQWYTAFLNSVNDHTKTLNITDDTVLECHNEDPALVQMRIIDNGVVQSILRGDAAPRRTSRQLTVKEQQSQNTVGRRQAQTTTTSSGQQSTAKQATVAPKLRGQGHSHPHPHPQHSPPSSTTTAQTAPTRPPLVRQASGSGERASSNRVKHHPPEKRKCRSEGRPAHQADEARLTCTEKRPRPVRSKEGQCVSLDQSSDRSSRTEGDHENSSGSISPPPSPLLCTPDVCIESGKVKSGSKPLRPKKGHNNNNYNNSLKSSSKKAASEEAHALGDLLLKKNAKGGKKNSASSIVTSSSLTLSPVTGKLAPATTPVSVTLKALSESQLSSSRKCKPKQEGKSRKGVKKCNESDAKAASGDSIANHGACASVQKGSQGVVSEQDATEAVESPASQATSSLVTQPVVSAAAALPDAPAPAEDTMHFKKQLLLAGGNNSPSSSAPHSHASSLSTNLSTGIDVNRSVTDQLTKLAKAEKIALGASDDKSDTDQSLNSDTPNFVTFSNSATPSVDSRSDLKGQDLLGDRQHRESSAFTCVRGNAQSNTPSSSSEERAESRASDSQLSSSGVGEDRRPGSRLDDLRSVKSSPTSSPLILDRSEPVNIYRDPELMSKNPVRSQLTLHKTMSGPTYPSVTPGGALTTSSSLPSHPSALNRPGLLPGLPYPSHQLTPGAMSHGLPLGHSYPLDALAVAAQQQQQHLAALTQYQNAAQLLHSAPYPARSLSQFESLWQQKYPQTPLPTSWLLKQHGEGLENLLPPRQQLERLEQERLAEHEKRLEMDRMERAAAADRMERERRDKRDKMERERVEREKVEKVERERAERERQERERMDKERKERELREWDQHRHQERERILRESADTSAQQAVDDHFVQSFNTVAKLKGIAPLGWPAPSITKGTGKAQVKMEIEKEERIKRELDHQRLMMSDDKRFVAQQLHEQQRGDHKPDLGSKDKPGYGYPPYHYGSGAGPPASKPEAIFNLYGYPSQQHSTITTEQLQKKGLAPGGRPLKEEKGLYAANPSPPRMGHLAMPAHQPKDAKPQSSVIVENKGKMEKPVAAHSHHASSLSSSSPRPHQPRPAHTPEQRQDRPLPPATNPSLPPHHMMGPATVAANSFMSQAHPTAFRSLDPKGLPRSQSPYKVVTGSQTVAMANPPLTNSGQPQPINFSSKGKGPGASSPSPYPQQVPVSVPASMPLSYSLIQQGLVPNPMYSQGSMPAAMHLARSQAGAPPLPHNAHPAPPSSQAGKPPQVSPPGSKRKSNANRDAGSLQSKRSKAGSAAPTEGMGVVSVPVTTPQVLTNPSPYTTSSSSPALSRTAAPTTLTQSLGYHETFRNFLDQTDSFKNLVDKTVVNEYRNEDKKLEREQGPSQPDVKPPLSNPHPQQPNAVCKTDTLKEEAGGACAPGAPHSSSMASIMDTINRVANGQDTDSDTLSAPSPPPARADNGASPQHRGGVCAPKLKKAWLQRHADDKKPWAAPLVPSPLVLAQEDSNSSQSTSREVSQFMKEASGVDASVTSVNGEVRSSPVVPPVIPSNGGASQFPANALTPNLNLPNGNISDLSVTHDESTSSASETESQTTPNGSKKRPKSKKPSSCKKAKGEEKEPSPILSSDPANSLTNNARSKKASSKRSKNDKESSNKKEKNSSPETGSSSPAPGSRKSPAPAPLPHNSPLSTPTPTPTPNNNNKKEDKSVKICPPSKQSRDNSCSPSPAGQESENRASPDIANGKDKKKVIRRSKELSKDPADKSDEQGSFNKPLVKCSMAQLKKSCHPFIQDGPCAELAPKLTKCRECKMTPNQRSKKIPNIFCRFYAFRRLKYNPKGALTIGGFSELSDADPDDIEPWLPRFPTEEPVLDEEMAKFILCKVGDKFCELVQQEKEAKSLLGSDPKIAWKRAVQGVREMCDVCDTTLFNMHWVCHKCGFVVCLDCYKAKIKTLDTSTADIAAESKNVSYGKWLTCSANRTAHDATKLMLTQIIPSDALWELGRLIHEVRRKWSIPAKCLCIQAQDSKVGGKNGMNQQLVKKMVNGVGEEGAGKKSKKAAAAAAAALAAQQAEAEKAEGEEYGQDNKLVLLANVALGGGDKPNKRSKPDPHDPLASDDPDKKSNCSTLRELLTKTAGKGKVASEKKSKAKTSNASLEDIIQSVVEKSHTPHSFKFLHYIPRLGQWTRELPIIAHNLTETSVLYPDVPHSWLCDGKLLRLHDPRHKGNLNIFQEQWKRGQPVLVSCVNKLLNKEIWKPATFCREFGSQDNDLVNCRNGNLISGNPMSDFWEGFESIENRLLDEDDQPILLKLKDWPPGEDFSDMLPSRFHDLMQGLPLPDYTQRCGKLNLASRLPDFLVRPDLGPKMYNAYGSARFPKEGTTNLHLDISDAVNVMVYVGVPGDTPAQQKGNEEAAVRAIDEAGCDSITKRRVREVHELPGALWQIYDAHDADKIRDFLNKVAKERGEIIAPDHDSIHDQSWYLDEELRDRLFKEYGVQGYTIVQCLGDAIFIPAGAPHQVRNLHSCIKVAEDFVSPEHLNHCFRLTQEFRQLSDTHSNHEDKLQVKNIIYHAVKDSIAVLREMDPDSKK